MYWIIHWIPYLLVTLPIHDDATCINPESFQLLPLDILDVRQLELPDEAVHRLFSANRWEMAQSIVEAVTVTGDRRGGLEALADWNVPLWETPGTKQFVRIFSPIDVIFVVLGKSMDNHIPHCSDRVSCNHMSWRIYVYIILSRFAAHGGSKFG